VKERKLGLSREEKDGAKRKACVQGGWEVVVL